MVAAAFSTSTGLSGGTGDTAHVPLLALESEHDRTQGTAREAEAIAMQTYSVAMIKVQTHKCFTLDSSGLFFWLKFESELKLDLNEVTLR